MGLKGIIRFFWRKLLISGIIIALVILLPNLPPNAEISQSLRVPKAKPLVGALALNEKLKEVDIWHKGDLSGAECFADFNGELYTGLNGGIIVKLVGDRILPVAKTGKPCKGYYEEHICGRPLGMQFDKTGNLIVADAYYGILKINVKTGDKQVLVSPDVKINGKKPKLFNSVALASNGDIYWTDSSSQFHLHDLLFDVLADPSGRLLHYDAKTKKNRVLIDKIAFANGVALSEDEDFVIVAETFLSKLYRYYLKGPKKGTHDIFFDGLPGVPDNLKNDGKGGFFVPLIESRDEEHPLLYQTIFPFPLLKKFLSRVMGITQLGFETLDRYYPSEFAQKAEHYIGHFSSIVGLFPTTRTTILRLSKTGQVVESLHTTDKKLRGISEIHVLKDHVYLGSPLNDYIGRIPLNSLGWEKPKAKRDVPVAEPKVEAKQVPKQAATPKVQTTTPPPVKQQTTPKPTTTPKPQTTPPPKPQTTQAPKTQPTQAPKPQTTQAPKPQPTPTPKQQAKPTPKQDSAPPKQREAPKQQTTPPPAKKPTTPPSQQQTVPPAKPQTAPPKKQNTAPPQQKQTGSEGSKPVPVKEPKVKN